jgi:aminoglycoside phosphotransferase (APT) family kinase protein
LRRQMSPDPGTDRHLDADVVRAVLREQFPEFADEPITYLGEGADNQVFAVGDAWLFRFPKRAHVVAWLQREITVMPLVDAVIGVRVPRFEKIGSPGPHFPYPFVGYRQLRGVPADEAQKMDRALVTAALGRALAALHSIDTAKIPPVPEEWGPGPIPSAVTQRDLLMLLPARFRDEARAFLNRATASPPFEGPPCLTHGDLLPEHVLIDAKTGGLAGIIDFADMVVGDPAGDFAALSSIGDYGFVTDVLANYSLPVDETFTDRLRWRMRSFNLHELVYAVESCKDVAEQQRVFVRVLEETALR